MKILFLADEESKVYWEYFKKEDFKDIDIIVSCGDLNPSYLSFLTTMVGIPLLYVHGNHDDKYKDKPPEGCISIEDKVYVYEGVRFALLFVGILGFGLAGAAIATVCGEYIGGFFPVIYFARKNGSLLRLGRTRFDGQVLIKTCINGSSELMTNLSSSIVNSLYNIQLMKIAGENGVAAYGTIMYVNFVFISIFFGYSIGSAPIISFNYGAGNHDELKNMFKKSLSLIAVWGISIAALAQILAGPFAGIFVGYDKELLAMTINGFRIYCLVYLINGFNIFGSSFFTALNNGIVSAVISFMRTLVFQILAIMILPVIFGINGIWSAIIVAEGLTLCITVYFMVRQRTHYKYV